MDGIHLITRRKKGIKNALMHLHDRIPLRKRSLIETVNDELKNVCQTEYTRHQSIHNFFSNLLAGLIAYQTFDEKPIFNLEHTERRDLVA